MCALAGAEGWFCWGRGAHGVDPFGISEIVYPSPYLAGTKVSLGSDHGCFLTYTGSVRCWSIDNAFGQVGNGSLDPWYAEPTAVVGLSATSRLETIANTTFAVHGGILYAWGDGSAGQVGDGGNVANRRVPTPVTGPVFSAPWELAKGSPVANHMCAVVDFAPRCWGANGSRQLGTSDTSTRHSPVAVNLP